MKAMWLFLLTALLWLPLGETYYEWSFQQRLLVKEAGAAYGITPPAIFGRGFVTMISGYDARNNSPGIFVHTTDEGLLRHGQYVWSQQAKLVPKGATSSDRFGQWMVATNTTLVVSAPYANSLRGFVYVFNGTQRHWSQIQRLRTGDSSSEDLFGEKMSLYKTRLIVSARGQASNAGAVYVYERQTNGLFWSLQSKLVPRDTDSGDNFGRDLSLYDTVAVISSTSDIRGDFMGVTPGNERTGSAYIFKGTGPLWSQQQKLVAVDMINYKTATQLDTIDVSLGQRYLGPSVTITDKLDVAIGIRTEDPNKTNKQTVYVYTTSSVTNKWSLQQKLFNPNESSLFPELHNSTEVYSIQDKLFTTVHGPNTSISYVFRSQGTSSWSLQSKLLSYNTSTDLPYFPNPDNVSDTSQTRPPLTSFTRPILWGGTLVYRADNEYHLRTPYRNDSCLQIWLSDHYRDGWDTAVLTVRAPDLTNDTFHPHCDQVEPFHVRYCPYSPDDEGVYIVKVFAATQARFYWEISWQVLEESTGKWYKGDFATKMLFHFSAETMSFRLSGSENLVHLDDACYRCETLAHASWATSQRAGQAAFWPLTVYGAPYYISDYAGRTLYVRGRVCEGVAKYSCYQTLSEGVYTLRLGQGLFGPETGFPLPDYFYEGCGVRGTGRQQLVFKVEAGQCTALQVYNYTGRCDRPPAVNPVLSQALGETVLAPPTAGGTVAPTQSVYGDVYIPGQMYAHRDRLQRQQVEVVEDHNDHVFLFP